MNWALMVLARVFGFILVLFLMIFAVVTAFVAIVLRLPGNLVTILSNLSFLAAANISKRVILMIRKYHLEKGMK